MTLQELLERTERDGDCLKWVGYRNADGYGYVTFRGRPKWRTHRVSYILANGPIPEDLEIDHLCRVRDCINPEHLEAVSHAVNIRRAFAAQIACRKAGHDWSDPRNVYTRPSGGRECRECKRLRYREAHCG